MKILKFDYYVEKKDRTLSETWDLAYNVAREYEGPRLDLISIKSTGEEEACDTPSWRAPVPAVYTFSAKYKWKSKEIKDRFDNEEI